MQFDPEADPIVLVKDLSVFEAPEVWAEAWFELIDITPEDIGLTPEDYAQAGLPNNAFSPPFLQLIQEALKSGDDGSLIPINPTELELWATFCRDLLRDLSVEELEELFYYNTDCAASVAEDMEELIAQAQCAQRHGVGIGFHFTY